MTRSVSASRSGDHGRGRVRACRRTDARWPASGRSGSVGGRKVHVTSSSRLFGRTVAGTSRTAAGALSRLTRVFSRTERRWRSCPTVFLLFSRVVCVPPPGGERFSSRPLAPAASSRTVWNGGLPGGGGLSGALPPSSATPATSHSPGGTTRLRRKSVLGGSAPKRSAACGGRPGCGRLSASLRAGCKAVRRRTVDHHG